MTLKHTYLNVFWNIKYFKSYFVLFLYFLHLIMYVDQVSIQEQEYAHICRVSELLALVSY